MRKLFSLFTLIILVIFTFPILTLANSVTLNIVKPYFISHLQYRVPTIHTNANHNYITENDYVSPLKATINGITYEAFCVDLFDYINAPRTYNDVSIISIDDYINDVYPTANNKYNNTKNLEYALYNLEKNWDYANTSDKNKAFTQLNIWNTLYDYFPNGDSGHGNQYYDSNFFVTNIYKYGNTNTNYDNDYINFNITHTGVDGNQNNTYNTTVLNAISGNTYKDVKDNYSVLVFGDGIGKQELIVRNSPVPEPPTLFLFGVGLFSFANIIKRKIRGKI